MERKTSDFTEEKSLTGLVNKSTDFESPESKQVAGFQLYRRKLFRERVLLQVDIVYFERDSVSGNYLNLYPTICVFSVDPYIDIHTISDLFFKQHGIRFKHGIRISEGNGFCREFITTQNMTMKEFTEGGKTLCIVGKSFSEIHLVSDFFMRILFP
jgi:hypothetical protein